MDEYDVVLILYQIIQVQTRLIELFVIIALIIVCEGEVVQCEYTVHFAELFYFLHINLSFLHLLIRLQINNGCGTLFTNLPNLVLKVWVGTYDDFRSWQMRTREVM